MVGGVFGAKVTVGRKEEERTRRAGREDRERSSAAQVMEPEKKRKS